MSPTNTLKDILNDISVKYTITTLERFTQHPSFPSLAAFSHTFSYVGIENVSIRTSYQEIIDELPKPFIAYHHSLGFLCVKQVDTDAVTFIENSKVKKITKEEFLIGWDGIVTILNVEEGSSFEEPNYKQNKISEYFKSLQKPLLVVGLVLLLFLQLDERVFTSFVHLPFYLLGILGLGVCIFLLLQMFDKDNPYIQKVCASEGKSACNSILDSNASKAFLGMSWAEVGFFYFLTCTLSFSFLFSSSLHSLYSTLSLLSFLYIPYSIIYQWKVAKQWCKLCLAVQGILLLQFIVTCSFFYQEGFHTLTFDLFEIGTVLALGISVIAGYFVLKPMLKEVYDSKKMLPKLKRIKYDDEVFQLLLNRRPLLEHRAPSSFKLGNPEGQYKILMVSNPTCKPCIEAHHQLFELLDHNEEVSVEEVFLAPANPEEMEVHNAAVVLASFYATGAYEKVRAYYEDGHHNVERFLTQNPVEDPSFNAVITAQSKWCIQYGLTSTPMIFINGRLLPKEYKMADLSYLLQ